MNKFENRRILFVDDMPEIHDNFRRIFAHGQSSAKLSEQEALLFDDAPAPVADRHFETDSAYQGAEALDKVRASLRANTPYAVAFIDMRMPPGWDGVETVERLWEVDPRLQVVFCTAFSDYSWTEVLNRLDVRDRLLILKKPFDPIEVYQLANALTTKWQITETVEERTRELSNANLIVQNSPVILYRLRGEPPFPLMYISHNITQLGHDPQTLVASPNWVQSLIFADDQAKVAEAMARVLDKDAQGSSIEFRLCTADGSLRWVENRYLPVRDKEGRLVEVEGIVIDITERKAAEEKIGLLARTDGLTGLQNRSTFMERLHQAFASAQRGGSPFAILYLDLDKFKPVNDTLGHPIGDLLLQQIAERLKGCTRETDLIARLGGDEFAVLQGEMSEAANAGVLAAKIQSALALPFTLNGNEVRISVSIGISPYVVGSADAGEMLAQADVALYRSKDRGGNQYHFHSESFDEEVRNRITLGAEIKGAIDREEFELHYQPQVELSSHKIVGMEALVRWNHPTRGQLAPGQFIPIAEKTGSIVALGHWVLERACRQMSLWRKEGLTVPVVAINLSWFQLKNGQDLVLDVTETLAKYNLAPLDIEFDVTEAMLAQLTLAQNDVLPELRQLGVKIAIDNFGGEYSSFEYIRAYRVNHLKIAQSYINRSTTDPESAATIRAIVNFAHDTGIIVIAQGVETAQQRDLLTLTDATTQAQGFHFSKAVGVEDAMQLLREGRIEPGCDDVDTDAPSREDALENGAGSTQIARRG